MPTDLVLSAQETMFVLNAISDRIDLLEELMDGNYGEAYWEAVDTEDWMEEQRTLANVFDRIVEERDVAAVWDRRFSGGENE